MDQLHLLFLLSFSMLVGSFLSGIVPMSFKMSDSKSRLLALMGSGILVGTALSIIIPEGIDSIYAQPEAQLPTATANENPALMPSSSHNHHNGAFSHKNLNINPTHTLEPEPVQTWMIGFSLIAGFVLMLFIDQFSLYQSGNDSSSSHHHHGQTLSSQQHDYSLAKQNDDDDDDEQEQDEEVVVYGNDLKMATDESETTSETGPIKGSSDTGHRISMRNMDNNCCSSKKQSINLNADSHPRSIGRTTNKTKVTPTLGLVIHAAADGIALGAAATTSHRHVEMIIFLAIMLHKAPAAFSLVVFLIHRGLKHSTIRRHLLAFSLSAPLAALLTYFGLSQSGKEALRRNNATGIAMLFSAGTFLYVATVHVLPELVHNILLTPKEMLFLVGGAFLPILLAQTI